MQLALTKHNNTVKNLDDQQKRAYLAWLQSTNQKDFVTQHDKSVEAKAIIPQWDIIESTFNEMQICNQEKLRIENEMKANAAAWANFNQKMDEAAEKCRKSRQSRTIQVIEPIRNNTNSTY